MNAENRSPGAGELRARAEAALLKKTGQTLETLEDLSPEAVRSLLFELHEDQIELEMQNEELRRALGNIEEREKYKTELQEKEERLSLATLHNGIGIWDWDLITQQLVWDDSMFVLYHIRREDFIGTEEAWRQALHPDDVERGVEEVEDAISGKKPFDTVFRVVWPNGEVRHIKAVAKVFRDEEGKALRMLGTNWDITERKLAEIALAAEKTRLRTVLDLLPMSVFVKDTESRFVVVNEGSAQALGAANWEDMIGKTDADYFPPATAATFLKKERRVLAGESLLNMEESSDAPDGTIRTELISKVPLRDADGNIVGLVGASRDITDRKQAEDALRLANQKLRLHFEQSPMAVIEWDLDFQVTRWNPAAGTIFGFSREEAVGQHASFIVPEAYRAHVDQIWQALVEKRGGERSTNENVRKDGSTILCEWYNTPLIDEHGACTGVASLVVDITESQQAKAELLKSNEELERRVAERTAKLRALATELVQVEERERLRIADTLHEGLLQLLAAGRVRLGILKDDLAQGTSPADFDELLQCFDESIQVGRTLTHELYPPALQALGLGAALNWLGEWHHDNYGLSVAVEDDLEIDIEEMELRITLFRAANELLNNVRKHAGVSQAQVSLRLASGGKVRLEVSDTGVGFDPEGVRAREGSKGGFGLFSLRERVEALGGSFEVGSACGRGCCITLLVPMGKSKVPGTQEAAVDSE